MRDTPNLAPLLRRLSWARLLVSGALLGVGALLTYWAVVPFNFPLFVLCLLGAAAGSGVYLAMQFKGSNLRRFAWLQLILDVALATAIVATSGGPGSIFSFLYVLTVTAACVLLSRQGGLVIAGLGSLLYAGIVLGRSALPLSLLMEPTETTALEVLTMFTMPGALLTVAILAGSLAERSQHMQQRLEIRERDLRDLQVFKDLIFESVGSGLVALDLAGCITAFNRAAEEITGFTAREAIGQRWETIFGDSISPPEMLMAVTTNLPRMRQQEIRLTRKDGRKIPLGISFWPLRSGEGELGGLIGICQDLSEIKQMEQRMRQADRLATIGRLAANIAHEIRNPLAAVSGAIEQLARELTLDDTRDRLMQIVLRESGRLNRIVAEFLEYARPAPLQRQAVNLAELLDEVILLLERHPLSANVKIVREYAPEVPEQLDPHQLRQALWNLCVNAVQAMPDGGELTVGARVRDGVGPRLEVWVTDTGEAIASEDLPHIFEPFFSTKPDGSGLGLAVVHRVVQDHGGEVEVRTVPGAGTTFTLNLPADPGAARR
ncbi:MAG: PAS domain S-box protein [Candidatus Rokubacteria bacterium]|nr:PAS domain S-box protein [Candidatus Rokubacteria bacterium]